MELVLVIVGLMLVAVLIDLRGSRRRRDDDGDMPDVADELAAAHSDWGPEAPDNAAESPPSRGGAVLACLLLLGALPLAPGLMVSGSGSASLLLYLLVPVLLGGIAGRWLSTGAGLAVILTAALLSGAGGWWAGDQYNWAEGGLRSEHPHGYASTASGLYPHIWATLLSVLAGVAGTLAWGVARVLRRR